MKKSRVLVRASLSDHDWVVKDGRREWYGGRSEWVLCDTGVDKWFDLDEAEEIRVCVDRKSFKGSYKVKVTNIYHECTSAEPEAKLRIYDPVAKVWRKYSTFSSLSRFVQPYANGKVFYAGIEIVK